MFSFKSICFLTYLQKLREVFAVDFKNRVIHHCAKRAQKFAWRYKDSYFLQLDIKGFFYNLDKNILFKQVFKEISRNDLPNKVIYHV